MRLLYVGTAGKRGVFLFSPIKSTDYIMKGIEMILDISKVIKAVKDEVELVKERDPAAKNTLEILLTYSGLHAILIYRVSHRLYVKKM